WGSTGEISALSLGVKAERFEDLLEVYRFGPGARNAAGARYEVESTWFHDRTLVFQFQGVDSISDAEPLSGAEVRVPLAERAALEPGEFFESDLVGCDVVDRSTGESLGRVSALQDGGGSGLL